MYPALFKISKGLKAANIWLDSTIYQDGLNLSPTKGFDFRNSSKKEIWRFESNPLHEDPTGSFVELPISRINISPVVYWKIALNKFIKSKKNKSFGDGLSLGSGSEQIIKLLTQKTNQPVFLDGIKSSSLVKSYKHFEELKRQYFVAIGHPKAMSKYSLNNIDELMRAPSRKFTTLIMERSSFRNH